MNALAIELQSYFTSFARDQRDLSPHTISSYRDTWRLLITYLSDTTGTRADRIDFADLTVESVTGFLDHLEHDRHNSTATRNARLSGIRAVLVHALPAQLDDAGTITRILAIPAKRHPTPQVEYLASDEADALIAAPDRSRWTGTSRPRATCPGTADRATDQRTALPGPQRHRSRCRRPRQVHRQGETPTLHTTDQRHDHDHVQLPC